MFSWLKKYLAVIHTVGKDVRLFQTGNRRIPLNYVIIITCFSCSSVLFSRGYFFFALEYAIAAACFCACFIDFGWLVPIVPSSL